METILTILGITVMFGGIFVVDSMFPKPAKAINSKPISVYVPHHIDEYGTIVMMKKINERI